MAAYRSLILWIMCHFFCCILGNVTECYDDLGMQSRNIADNQLSASGHDGGAHTQTSARLHGNRAWRAEKGNPNPWIQVHFDDLTTISGIATQGRPDGKLKDNQWVTKYRVQYNTMMKFESGKNITDCEENEIFSGNSDRNTVVFNSFLKPVTVSNIRIFPKENMGNFALRFELYGTCRCEVPSTLMTIISENSDVTTASDVLNTVPISEITSPFQSDTTNASSANDPNLSGKARQSSSSTGTIFGVIIGVLLILGLLFVMLGLLKRRQARDGTNSNKRSDEENHPKRRGIATEGGEHHNPVYQSGIDEQQPHSKNIMSSKENIQSNPEESNNKGLIHIYACSQYGGRPSAAKDQDDIYHDINDDPGEGSYAVVESKDPPGSPITGDGRDNAHDEGWEENRIYAQGTNEGEHGQEKVNEGWEENGIYASENDEEGQDPNKAGEKTEGWGDNNIYACTCENEIDQE